MSEGARRRSRLNWLILKTVALDAAAPMTGALVVQVLGTRRSEMLRPIPPGSLRGSLHRLVERGLVRLQELRGRRTLTLTPKGRLELEALEGYWKARGVKWEPPRPGDLRPGRSARWARLRASVAEADRRFPGRPRARAFVSYDLPRGRSGRREILRVFRESGYERLHDSFYVGPAGRLRAVVEALEGMGLAGHLRWGTLTLLST